MKKHILVISQYFYPEEFRINDICKEWINRGYEVTVITGIPNYPYGEFYKGYGLFQKRIENYKGINIVRLPIISRGRNPIKLSLNYLSFVVSGWFWSMFTRIKADFVYIYEVSPMTQALPGVWFSKRRKVPCYLYVTDLWPENVEIVTGVKNKFIIGTIGKMVDYIYKNCNKIFTSSNRFIGAINKRGIARDKIEFWPQYAEDYYKHVETNFAKVPEILQDGKFNIIFAGNIGVAQGLEILPKTAKILYEKGCSVRFNIVGDGRYKKTLIDMVSTSKMDDMFSFIDKQPPTRIPELMAVSDAALISLSKSEVFSITIPAKTQSCLACGIPIIVSADGEIQDIINDARCGICSNSGDYIMLAEKIMELIKKSPEDLKEMAMNGMQYYNENFEKEMLLNRIDKYFN